MTALWTLIGLPIAMRVAARAPCFLWAPALGWAIYSAVSLALFRVIGMSRPAVLSATAAFDPSRHYLIQPRMEPTSIM